MPDTKKLSIKEWSEDDRPREKLLAKGISSLSDAELIAIVIGSGNRTESAVELSKRILSSVNNNLNALGKLNIAKLMEFNGIGEAKAIGIVATLELGRRRALTDVLQLSSIKSSRHIFEIFQPLLADLPHEEFWILFLNQSNKMIDRTRISQGGITGTVIDVRIVMKLALEKFATSIVLCHNHPSGNMEASEADRRITKKMKDAGIILDINVIDHVIVCNDKYISFADNGWI